MEFTIIFNIIKAYGLKAGGIAVLVLGFAGTMKAIFGLFQKILDKRDLERAQLVAVLQNQVAQMNGVISTYDRRTSEFLTKTTEVQAGILLTQKQMADEMKEIRREAGVAHLGLSNGLAALSIALANLNGLCQAKKP